MPQALNSPQASLIPPQPMPAGAQDFSKRVQQLLDGKQKDEASVAQALVGMEAMLDAIAAGLYSLASMLVEMCIRDSRPANPTISIVGAIFSNP